MIADAQPGPDARRPGSAGRSVAVLAAWYGAALLPLAVWLGPELAKPEPEPVRQCTGRTLACFDWSMSDMVGYVVLPILLSCLGTSLVVLVLMVRRGSRAMAAGTVAALTGWVFGPFVILLVLVVWLVPLLIIKN